MKPNVNQKLNKHITLRTRHHVKIIDKKDIILIEANRSYCKFYWDNDKSIILTKPLKYFEDKLPGNIFFRCHRSFLVNVQTIQGIDSRNKFVFLKNGKKIPISKVNIKKILGFLEA